MGNEDERVRPLTGIVKVIPGSQLVMLNPELHFYEFVGKLNAVFKNRLYC
jgi:hypothetical protein